MNNYPQMINPEFDNINFQYGNEFRNINNQINMLSQEIRRLQRRLFNLEKNFMPRPYNKITPTPMSEDTFDYMNSNYSKDNYMI